MRRSLLWLVGGLGCGLAVGCAEIVGSTADAGPPRMDALVGGSGPDSGWQPATDLAVSRRPQDWGTPASADSGEAGDAAGAEADGGAGGADRGAGGADRGPGGADGGGGWSPDAGCRPNTRLAQCVVCSPDGRPVPPEDDGTCPAFDCGPALEYVRRAEGAVEVCVERTRIPAASRCQGLGVCHDAEGFCGAAVEREVARSGGACQAFEGCEGASPPTPRLAPGSVCHEVGVCRQDGTCTAPPGCERFADARILCAGGFVGDVGYCELYIRERMRCDEYCARWGGQCLAALRDQNNSCVVIGERGCGDRADDQICRCSLP